ncbi:penicillin-binding protein activator [Aggregatibacter aphrophilus]|jgi:lppC|uniref:penicillin-binding protein activator n=1 Tax=Aggregatibacter kilianii TaxID=2025884 RepID=UPI000DADE679|nr:penicillin-binding protein activator [Aggregatibacter kilianii]RDF02957.1 penicillin-binding protein activator [Aggregatibacter aphrophilus]
MSILLQRINLKNRLMPFLFTLFLAGCTTNFFGSSFTDELKKDAYASSEFYMNKIGQTQNIEDQQTYKLLAARVLVAENKVAQAQSLLNELTELNPEQLLDKSLIDAHIAAVKGKNQEAENLLRSINLTQLSASQVGRYYAVQARVAENKNAIIDAVKARIQMDQVLTDVQRKQENNDRTWALLRRANRGLLNNTSDEGNLALAGWLALSRAYNDNLNQPAQLSQALQNWKSSYPNHSAAYLFPTELQGLFNFQQTSLSQVALLLPLSGNGQILGNTIKSGFDAAKGDNTSIQVQVYDTVTTPVNEIIEQAKQAGVRALIGPLLKQNVDNVLSNPSAIQGIDVLALNSTPNARAIGQVCYYGLSPEDEAESAANKMWKDGIRDPMVAVPQGDLGQRTATAFNIRWQQLAGTDANIKYYHQAGDVGVALQGQNVQGLYIVAKSEELADVKSVIDNSGNNVKLYASSRSNSSNNGPEYRLLMNGLQFSDIPFFKDTDSAQYQKISTNTNSDYSLMRLYAMGADAWLLINHFNELRQVPGYQIDGLTGKLSAGPNCNIERDMTWFQYQNGGIQVLN